MIKSILSLIAVVIVGLFIFISINTFENDSLSSKINSIEAKVNVLSDQVLVYTDDVNVLSCQIFELQTIVAKIKVFNEDRDTLLKQAEVIKILTTKIEKQDAETKIIITRAIEIQRVNEELQAALIKVNQKK